MILGHCRTNLDDYDCSQVTKFVAVPNIGDRVTVRHKGSYTTLKVVSITHRMDGELPYIEIELHN